MQEETALALVEAGDLTLQREPELTLADAEKSARVLAERLFSKLPPPIINGKKYPVVEHWQTVASFYGVTSRIVSCVFVQYGEASGFEAVSEAVTLNGSVISRAEALCLNDEPRWNGRPLHQVKAMAQTRAISRCLRNVFSRIMLLAGCEATPAEDADGTWDKNTPTSRPVASGVTSGAGDRQPIQQPKPKAQNPGQPISEAQGKRIWGIAKQAYGSDTAAKEAKVKAVLAAFGFEKQTDVTRDQYEALCEAIANLNWQAPTSAPVQNLDVAVETLNLEGEIVQVVDKRTDKTPHMSLSISGGFELGTSDTVLWPIVENAKGKQGLFKCARKKGTPNPQRLKLLEILRLEEVIRYDKSESQAPAIDWEV